MHRSNLYCVFVAALSLLWLLTLEALARTQQVFDNQMWQPVAQILSPETEGIIGQGSLS